MKYRIIVRPEAEDDLSQTFSWYEDKRKGLGHDFLLQVDAAIRLLARNPEIHPIEYKSTRKHLIKRFPFSIIYFVDQKSIIVLGVLHGKRSPSAAEKRKETI